MQRANGNGHARYAKKVFLFSFSRRGSVVYRALDAVFLQQVLQGPLDVVSHVSGVGCGAIVRRNLAFDGSRQLIIGEPNEVIKSDGGCPTLSFFDVEDYRDLIVFGDGAVADVCN